jgi:hypothetical protein
MTARKRAMVDDEVAAAAENSLPSASKGLPPPLWPALSVGLLVALADGQVEGILGASKICDDSVAVVVSLLSAEDVLEADSVGPGDELVSTTRLVGTSVELAVFVLLTTVVVGCSDFEECFVGVSMLVGVAVDACCDCRTSFALVHSPCGPLPFKKTARTLDLSSRSRSPSLPQASLMMSVIESKPLIHLTLHPFWVKSVDSHPGMACL